METAFIRYLETIFEHPEIISASVRNVVIDRENIEDSGKRAFEAGFHDCFSDTDLSVKVCLPSDGSVTPDQYMKRIDRFGVNSTTALGWCFVPENKMYRIIFRDGMRYGGDSWTRTNGLTSLRSFGQVRNRRTNALERRLYLLLTTLPPSLHPPLAALGSAPNRCERCALTTRTIDPTVYCRGH